MRVRIVVVCVGLLVAATACGDDSPRAGNATSALVDTEAPTAGSVAMTAGPSAQAAGSVTNVPARTTAPAGRESDLALEGREFVSLDVAGHELVEGSQIRLAFGDWLDASAGCNFLSATWSLDGDRLVITEISATEMACQPSALMEQDEWLASFLMADPTVTLDGATITLTGGPVEIRLVDDEVAEPDVSLEDTPWALTDLINAPAVASVPGTPAPTVNFTDGQIAIDTGCNTGGANFEADPGTLSIGPIRLTRMACTNPDASAREAAVLAVLEGTSTYEIEADTLTITKGDAGLIYRGSDTDS